MADNVILPASGTGDVNPKASTQQVSADSSQVQDVSLTIVTGGVRTRNPNIPTVGATASTATLSNVSGSASSVTLIALNTLRLGFVIVNDSTAVLYVKFGSTASATSLTYILQPGATLDSTGMHFNYTGIITGIWASATGAARCTELTA